MARLEEWWEQGPGSVSPEASGINPNLGIYGWDLLMCDAGVEIFQIYQPLLDE